MKKADHLDRLVLMLSIALYWAVSTGYWVSLHEGRLLQKKHYVKIMP